MIHDTKCMVLHGASVDAMVGQDTPSQPQLIEAARTASITCPPPNATYVLASILFA